MLQPEPDTGLFLSPLRTRAALDGRTFGFVQQSELNSGDVRVDRHLAAERINFSDHLTLGPQPPIARLQLIWAMVSILPERSRVEAPIRDAAKAASTPAWPAPHTITSNGILDQHIIANTTNYDSLPLGTTIRKRAISQCRTWRKVGRASAHYPPCRGCPRRRRVFHVDHWPVARPGRSD